MHKNDDGSTTYDQDDVKAMTPEVVNNIFVGKVKVEGKGVVRGADGKIRYDAEAVPGEYGEETLT